MLHLCIDDGISASTQKEKKLALLRKLRENTKRTRTRRRELRSMRAGSAQNSSEHSIVPPSPSLSAHQHGHSLLHAHSSWMAQTTEATPTRSLQTMFCCLWQRAAQIPLVCRAFYSWAAMGLRIRVIHSHRCVQVVQHVDGFSFSLSNTHTHIHHISFNVHNLHVLLAV